MYKKTEIVEQNIEQNPRCPHGPTILFIDEVKGKKRKYYACSAYRDKKFCDFHHEDGEKISESKQFRWDQKVTEFMKDKNHSSRYQVCQKFRETETNGHFCQSCEVICNIKDHQTHNVTKFKTSDLKNPSKIIQAKSANKKEAQYFFKPETLEYLKEVIRSVGVVDILCIGTPTLFEALPSSINKLFLDIDSRYMGLFSPAEFCWFNMLNFHFFHERSRAVYETFVRAASSTLAVVLDPPFGARPELVLQTIEKISADLRKIHIGAELKLFWIFPYFMEKKLKELNLGLEMCDYQISYTNHKGFSGEDSGRKHGSPVRIFTNVPLRELPMPNCDGYQHCADCGFFVRKTNKHCKLCKACTSKDGRPYVHCNSCGRCVKETYVHCDQCNKCHLPSYNCNQQNVKSDLLQADNRKPPTNGLKRKNKKKNGNRNDKKRKKF